MRDACLLYVTRVLPDPSDTYHCVGDCLSRDPRVCFIGVLPMREYPNHYRAPDWSGNHPVQPWPYDVRLGFVRKAYLLLRLTDTATIAVPDIIYHNRLASKTTGFIKINNYY